MIDKKQLRAEMRRARDAFVSDAPCAIAAPAPLAAMLRPGMVVAAYVPVGSEADPAPLVAAAPPLEAAADAGGACHPAAAGSSPLLDIARDWLDLAEDARTGRRAREGRPKR